MNTGNDTQSAKQKIEYFNVSLSAQLLLVTRISLWVGLLSLVVVSAAILMILPAIPDDYAKFIQYMAKVQYNLPLMIGLSAALLISGAGFTVWIICLYSSFRIAGPLYRFSRNLEQQIADGPTQMLQIRNDDELQGESQLFNQATEHLTTFYARIKQASQALRDKIKNEMMLNKAEQDNSLKNDVALIQKQMHSVQLTN